MAVNLSKEDREEIAQLFVGSMTPLLEEREAEIKKSVSGEFDTAIQRHIDGINHRIDEIETKGKRPNLSLIQGGASNEDAETKQAKVDAALAYIRKGYLRMPREQRELLKVGDGADIEGMQ